MSAVPKPKLTVAEYLAVERAAEFKSEFYRGETFAMAGASYEHTTVSDNLVGELRSRLKGTGCRVLSRDMRVRVDATGLYTYPDVLILCGPPVLEDDHGDVLLNPRIIFEVLSDSTERYDRTTKFRHYQQIPTLTEYLLVAQDEPSVERFVRGPDGDWAYRAFTDPDGAFELVLHNLRVPLAEVYRDVEFPDPPPGSAQTRPRPGG